MLDIIEATEKQCRVCSEVLPLSSFAMRNKETGRRDNKCKACRTAAERERSRQRREDNEPMGSFSPPDPWAYLAMAVIKQAALDYRRAKRRGVTAPLVSFFRSEWCECLCDLAGYSPERVRERMGV